MLIALIANFSKPDHIKTAAEVATFFKSHNIDLTAEAQLAKQLSIPSFDDVSLDKVSTLITLGGDGSILRAAHTYSRIKAPILGINLGSLGFMADVPKKNMELCLTDLINGDFVVEKRLVLEGQLSSSSPFLAFNDIVLHRGKNPSLITLGVYLGDKLLNSFKADGLIFSTPTGSTAYNLASGGPILSPKLDAYVLTPICAHTISNRPIVLHPSEELLIKVLKPSDFPVEVVSDGTTSHALQADESLMISRSAASFELIKLGRIDYFSTLRSKLGWSGTLT